MRRLALLVVIAAIVAAAVRALRGPPVPAFSRHPSVDRGPRPAAEPATAATSAPPTRVVEATLAPVADVAATEVPAPRPDPTVVASAPVSSAEPDATGTSPPQRWTDPVDGSCPDGYLVKAKLSSGIFHIPGGMAYQRTNPDRCYRSPADAEADGLRAAKR
ncbi:MAG: hypothetical protein ACR2MB_13300 [Acidimicrobiales bacterium]